jgi:hypothetical protein
VYYELRSRDALSSAWSSELSCRHAAPSCTLQALAPAESFQLSVRAFSTACCTSEGGLLPGEWSAPIDASTQPEPVPAPPHDLRQAFTAATLLAVMWEPPTNLPPGLLGHLSFAVQLAERNGTGACIGWRSVAGAITPGLPRLAHFASLRPSTPYCVRVSATSLAGVSQWSPALHAATSTGNATVPTPPAELNATPSFDSVSLTWRPPLSDGGASILAFQAECLRAEGAEGEAAVGVFSAAAGERPVPSRRLGSEGGLALQEQHLPELALPGPALPGPASQGLALQGLAAAALVSEGLVASPGLTSRGMTLQGLALRAAGAGAPISPAECTARGSIASSCTALGAAAGTAYHCRVRALNSVGPSDWSSPVQISTLHASAPATPGSPSISEMDSLLLRWGPAEERGAPVLAYELQARDWWTPDAGWVVVYNGSQPQLDTRDLPLPDPLYGLRLLPAVPYPLRVRALSRLGPSPWGPTSNLTLLPQRGGCGMSDEAAFRDAPAATKAGIQSGLVACVTAADRAACAQSRIQEQVGLSAPCAACWVQEGLCSMKHCVLPCLQPASARCSRCSQASCFPACVLCSGMPEWAFPP